MLNSSLHLSVLIVIISFCVILGQIAVPAPPDNIVCFPERDFCTIENFYAYQGSSLELRVVRGTGPTATTVGSAIGVVSGGAVAFEVNHPGGLCWGDGTNIKVTPDIKAGDTIQLLNGQSVIATSVIQDGSVTGTALNRNVYTVNGRIGASVNPNFIEVVVVNPALRDTDIGRRVVIATPTVTTEPTYDSQITFGTGGTFTATFTFKAGPTQSANQLASIVYNGKGESLSMWVADVGGNTQGLTISEFGEAGGPMSALCPPGPGSFGSPSPAQVIVHGKSVLWSPAIVEPGAPVVETYEVFINKLDSVNGFTVQNGYRVNGQTTQLTDTRSFLLPTTTTIELKTANGRSSYRKSINLTTRTAGTQPVSLVFGALQFDTTTSTSTFTMTSNTNQIVYTLDGSEPINTLADGITKVISSTAKVYSGPVTIGNTFTVKAAAVDRDGRVTSSSNIYTVPAVNKPPPAQVINVRARVDPEGIRVSWKPIMNDPTFRSYTLTITKDGVPQTPIVTSQVPYIARGLTIGSIYSFTVSATNQFGTGPTSTATPALTMKVVDALSSKAYDWRVGDFRISGASSISGAVIKLYYADWTTGDIGAPFSVTTNGAQVTGIANGAAGGGGFAFDIRLRGPDVTTPIFPAPLIYIVSDKGGILGPTF